MSDKGRGWRESREGMIMHEFQAGIEDFKLRPGSITRPEPKSRSKPRQEQSAMVFFLSQKLFETRYVGPDIASLIINQLLLSELDHHAGDDFAG